MNKLFTFSYWLQPLPGSPNLMFWRVILAVAAFCLLAGIISIVQYRRHRTDGVRRKAWGKLIGWGWTTGVVLLMLAFFRYQNAYLLSARGWIAAWLVFAVVWAGFIIKYWKFVMPRRLKERAEQEAFAKYLPKRK